MNATTNNRTPAQFRVEMVAAYQAANERYKAKPSNAAMVASMKENEVQKDIARGLKFWVGERGEKIAALALSSCDADALLKFVRVDAGVKACLRMPEFLDALVAKDYSKLDLVTTLDIISAACAGGAHREALRFAATGKGDESTSDLVSNIALVRRVQKLVGTEKAASENTRVSRSFGVNGFAGGLNMGKLAKNEHKQTVLQVNVKSKLYRAMVNMLETASDNTLQLMVKKGSKAA